MKNLAGMINAFNYGAPPHGGIAPGIDRIVMLLADKQNIKRSYFVSNEPKRSGFNDECAIRNYDKQLKRTEH